MTHESLLDRDWDNVVERLGGKETLIASAKATKAFLRARAFENAIGMLGLTAACVLRRRGRPLLGSPAFANTALLYRLRQSERWLAWLLEQMLPAATPQSCRGCIIRVIDAMAVLKAGAAAKTKNGLWRIHSAFDLPSERFGYFELTDEHGGERLDRIPAIKGEIRLADRAYMQPDQIAQSFSGRR